MLRRSLRSGAALALGALLWYLVTDLLKVIPSQRLPGPSAIGESLLYLVFEGDMAGGTRYGRNILGHTSVTVIRVLWGFALALVVGIPLGLGMGLSDRVDRFFRPYVELIRPVPPIAFIPITIVLLGFGLSQKVFLVFLGGIWPILFNTIQGVRTLPTNLMRAGMMLGMSRTRLVLQVVIPAALPQIFLGARIGVGTSTVMVFGAEFIGASDGIGWMTIMAESLLSTSDVIIGMAFMGLIGAVLTLLVRAIEHAAIRPRVLRSE